MLSYYLNKKIWNQITTKNEDGLNKSTEMIKKSKQLIDRNTSN